MQGFSERVLSRIVGRALFDVEYSVHRVVIGYLSRLFFPDIVLYLQIDHPVSLEALLEGVPGVYDAVVCTIGALFHCRVLIVPDCPVVRGVFD